MKIALISDIHGNLPALEAVLKAIAAEQVDQIICLGDVAVFGPQPSAGMARLRQLACRFVMGNTDAWALQPTPHPYRDEETVFYNGIEMWSAAQLTPADKAMLATFPAIDTVLLGKGDTLLCCHGSPRSFHEAIEATIPEAELAAMLAGHAPTIVACGHTHTTLWRRVEERVFVNPGSVGLPLVVGETGRFLHPHYAEYATLTYHRQHTITITFHRIPYDVGELVAAVRNSTMPHQDWWLSRWLPE